MELDRRTLLTTTLSAAAGLATTVLGAAPGAAARPSWDPDQGVTAPEDLMKELVRLGDLQREQAQQWVDDVLDPWVASIYPIPKSALFPLFLLWFGLGDSSKISTTRGRDDDAAGPFSRLATKLRRTREASS